MAEVLAVSLHEERRAIAEWRLHRIMVRLCYWAAIFVVAAAGFFAPIERRSVILVRANVSAVRAERLAPLIQAAMRALRASEAPIAGNDGPRGGGQC
jgi:hypothetical protein